MAFYVRGQNDPPFLFALTDTKTFLINYWID